MASETGGLNFTPYLIFINLNLATRSSSYSIGQHSSRSMTSLQVIQGIEESVKGHRENAISQIRKVGN